MTVTGSPDSVDKRGCQNVTPPRLGDQCVGRERDWGGGSSSRMVAVCCWTPLSVPLVMLVISTMTVSLSSSIVSLARRDGTVPVRLPAGITICTPQRV